MFLSMSSLCINQTHTFGLKCQSYILMHHFTLKIYFPHNLILSQVMMVFGHKLHSLLQQIIFHRVRLQYFTSGTPVKAQR